MSEEEIKKIVEQVVNRVLQVQEQQAIARVALGGDHGGYKLKDYLIGRLNEAGFQTEDCGTSSDASVDYPDYAAAVAAKVASGECQRGIVIDGAGIGSSMAANKVRGVRAALCYSEQTVLNSRLHNDANVLTLGARFHSNTEAEKLVKLWLSTEFEGGRHQKRIDKIMALEQ